MEGGSQESQTISIEELLKQAFTLVFKDEYITFPKAVMNVFFNEVNESMSSKDFLQSKNDHNVLRLKNAIYYSLKLAFHMGNTKLYMGERDDLERQELEVSATIQLYSIRLLTIDLLFCRMRSRQRMENGSWVVKTSCGTKQSREASLSWRESW